MNLNDHGKNKQGSFGIPKEIKEAADRQKASKEANTRQSKVQEAEQKPAEDAIEQGEQASGDEAVKQETPEMILEKIGAKFTEDDFQKLIFKGVYETTIPIVKDRLTAKMRTLTAEEYDEIDAIIAAEIKVTPMTHEGLQARTSMWIISYGVVELNGKPVTKVVAKATRQETSEARRKVFSAMAPAIINQLVQKHGTITVAINTIVSNPADNLKNS